MLFTALPGALDGQKCCLGMGGGEAGFMVRQACVVMLVNDQSPEPQFSSLSNPTVILHRGRVGIS